MLRNSGESEASAGRNIEFLRIKRIHRRFVPWRISAVEKLGWADANRLIGGFFYLP